MSLVYAKNSGTLQCMGGAVNLNSIIQAVAPGGGGGVSSVAGVTGAVLLSSVSDTVNIEVNDKSINLDIPNFQADVVGMVGTSADTPSNDTSLWALAKNTSALLPRFEYTSVVATTALTGVYQNFGSSIITTNVASCPILAWGTINIADTGSGSVVSVRLVIGTHTSDPITVNVPGGQRISVSPIYQNIGNNPPNSVNVRIQALVSAGTASVMMAQTVAVANPIQA
jgi:hypothetical protein